jgi:hypothetical protein
MKKETNDDKIQLGTFCTRLDAPYRPGAAHRASLATKAEKLIETISHTNSPDATVCDSVMRCRGWKDFTIKLRWVSTLTAEYMELIQATFKFCPWCGKEIKWDIET